MDQQGEAPRIYSGAELGFFYNDTRYLSVWETTYNGQSAVPLARELRFDGNTVIYSMTNRDFPIIGGSSSSGISRIPRDTFLIRRIQVLWQDRLFETLEIKNFGDQTYSLQIENWAGGRFDDVFEVRGFQRPRRGKMLAAQEKELGGRRAAVLSYEGLDGLIRNTVIHRLFEFEKIRVSPLLVGIFSRIQIPPKETVALKTVVSFGEFKGLSFFGTDYSELAIADQMAKLSKNYSTSQVIQARVDTDNAIINRAIRSAETDIHTLTTVESGGLQYPYAGIPWFSAPFGRDGLITAYQLLPWHPALARGVLDYAFQCIGKKSDSFTEEELGKVFHEMRRGEMARTREVPFIPYYGSIDSTPLALILLSEYIRWTLDLESLRRWWPDVELALSWLEAQGGPDGEFFLEYKKTSPTGLINQGWKDSHDSVMHRDGKLATAPIRICEAQAYAFRARMGVSDLARLLGRVDQAERLRRHALRLRARFIEKFWDSSRRFIYLALDGEGKPCEVMTSNMGHCLWAEILLQQQARDVASHLMSDPLFSGHGIRTLADFEVAFNPLSYHNGSVWPHDNSLIMEGFRNYGFINELERLVLAFVGVVESSSDFRLPELFCGFRKRGNEAPVPYEVACKPQAWAAGSIFLMIKSMLGVAMDLDQSYLVLNAPLLTPKVGHLEVRGLRCRDWEVDLSVRGSRNGRGAVQVGVVKKNGSPRVLTVRD